MRSLKRLMVSCGTGESGGGGGGGGDIVFASNRTFYSYAVYPGSGSLALSYTLYFNTVYSTDGVLSTEIGTTNDGETITPALGGTEWLPAGDSSLWEMRVTKTAGSYPDSDSFDMQLGSPWTEMWQFGFINLLVSGSGPTSKSCTMTFEFREIANPSNSYTFTNVTMELAIL